MTSSPTPDFGARAATYDDLRPTDENWWEVYEALVREGDLAGRRVLDVGCVTGRFAAQLASQARVWAVDRSRFPTRADFEAELPHAGFEPPRFVRLSQRAAVTREVALERIRGRHIATFDLISDDEYHAGLERAERELPERVEYRQEWLI